MTGVSIVGWAHSPFGKLEDPDTESLIARVVAPAIADAGLSPKDIDGAIDLRRTGGGGDLGGGPQLVSYLDLRDDAGMMRRTEIDLNGSTATIGRSDIVPQTADISCGGLTMQRDGVQAPD